MSSTIVCFGEVLWDILPSGKIAGGAPMNVAFQANNLGAKASMISRIGTDELGKELLTFLKQKGVATDLVQLDNSHDTGTVLVQLDEKGSPSYEIVGNVAWDFINLTENAKQAVSNADALIFGTLATRSERSRQTLMALLKEAKLKVLDVNLRIPFYSTETLEPLLEQADIVKMNDEELELIGAWYSKITDYHALALALKHQFGWKTLIVTEGAKGAFVLQDGQRFSQPVFPITVQDTIGSGDAFLAGFITQYLSEKPADICLEFACATGAVVATHKGGTPAISGERISAFIKSKTS